MNVYRFFSLLLFSSIHISLLFFSMTIVYYQFNSALSLFIDHHHHLFQYDDDDIEQV